MEENVQPNQNPPRVRDLFVWQSASHPTVAYPKGSFLTLGSLVVILTVVLILFREWLAIAVSWAAYFLFFALTKMPAVSVEHKITTEGLVSMNHSYIWAELGPFWFTTSHQELVLHIARRGFFGHLLIVVNSADKEKITEILAEYLPFIEVPEKTSWEKFSAWFARTILKEKASAPDRS